MGRPIFTGQLDIYSISSKKRLRTCGSKGELSGLGSDEYFSFTLCVQSAADRAFSWEQAYVIVDNGTPWRWSKGRIEACGHAAFHIAHRNMKGCMTPGTHRAVWYFDGQAVHSQQFVITQKWRWESVFPIPSGQEIAAYRNVRNLRSPYLTGWFLLPAETRYTEYAVEFKADHVPKGTYCCLGNWAMDYSNLKKQYRSVRTAYDSAHAYAGFQRIADGRMVSIMSFWDIYCQDALGNQTTISAKRLYPETVIDGGRFWGEGDGARSTAPFPWEAGHWYRMHLKCISSGDKTLLEQWVWDLATGKSTLLCRYEIAVANTAFLGSIAVFLENYLTETAGQVRSMEVRNARYRDADTKQWHRIGQVHLSSRDGVPNYEGSYNFGVTDGRIWMITSGVGGDWYHNGKGKKGATFHVPTSDL